jgi:hypothetical protein
MQQRLRNFEHAILSFDHNVFNFGLHSPGRYLGFDEILKFNGMTFGIGHTKSNFTYLNPNGDTIGPIGVYMTPQGTLIQETDRIGPFTCESNVGNQFYRYDLVYAIHNHIELNGGQPATYALLKGQVGSLSKPTVPDPLRMTPLGYVELPPNTGGNISDCTWIKARCPDSGDGVDARLEDVNIFSKTQGFSMSPVILGVPTISYLSGTVNTVNIWELDNLGNTYRILPSYSAEVPTATLDGIKLLGVPLRNGIRIKVMINEKITVRKTELENTYKANGYSGFEFKDSLLNVGIDDPIGVSGSKGIRPGIGQLWELDMVYIDGLWNITGMGGQSQLKIFAPNSEIWANNLTQILDGGLAGRPGELLIYSGLPEIPYSVLYTGSYHIGDLQDPGLDYDVKFTKDGISFNVLNTRDYTVLGTLVSAGSNHGNDCSGVWTVIKGSKDLTGFKIHVNEYSHNITQDLYLEYAIVKNA